MSDAEVADLTMCPKCKQTYTEPSQLPCRDTLCKKCFFALDAVTTADQKQVRRCPLCSHECQASGAELKPDTRAAWIIRTRKASAERQQRENAKGRCSLPHCGEPAVNRGLYFEGSLCSAHVKTDEEKFAEIKLSAESLLQSVRGLTKKRKDALADLQAERADTGELFDVIDARLQRCRKQTLGRIDSAIDKLKLELRAVEFIEKLQVEIQDAEKVGDQLLSARLFKQLHLSLADVDAKAGWASSADETVELAQHMLSSIEVLAADVENGKGTFIRSCMEHREPVCHDIYARGMTPIVVATCGRTDGFYYSETAVSKQCQSGMQPMPAKCTVAFGKKEAGGYFAAAPNSKELLVQYYDVFGKYCGQFSLELDCSAAHLVSADCSSHLQRLFLLTSSSSTAAGAESASAAAAATAATPTPTASSELTVTDLAGTQLQSLKDLQIGGPARSLTCSGDYLSTATLYVLGSGQMACLSADTCQIQECVQLPIEVKDARCVAASGRRLVLATPRAAHLMSPVTKAVTRLLTIGDKDPELKRAAAIGCGFAAVSDASRWLCFVARSGTVARTHRGYAEATCIGRLEEFGLRIFAMRPGK